jgi:two-component system, LytTR family, sensor kinase
MRWFSHLPVFWRLQLGGWLAFTVCTFPLKIAAFGTVQAAVLLSAFREPLGLLLSLGLRKIYRRIDRRRGFTIRLSVLVLVLAIACGSVDTLASIAVAKALGIPTRELEDVTYSIGVFSFRASLYACWSLLYFWIKAVRESHERELRLVRAETQQRDAELRMLRAQINPHFLFNALNTILAGLGREQQGLQTAVQGLADYLRFSLAHRHADRVPLGEEFDAIVNYLAMEKARFGEDLLVESRIEDEARNFLVPGILMQPLVENALKHGWKNAVPPLRLRLLARREEDKVHIEIANTGPWIEASKEFRDDASGTGLDNVRRRLGLLYEGRHQFEIGEREGWVVARISLPAENGSQA